MIVGYVIYLLPFLAVLFMPKSVGARLCMFVMMLIDVILSIIGYVFVVIAMFMLAGWWAEQAMVTQEKKNDPPNSSEDRQDYLNMLEASMEGFSFWTYVAAYIAMGTFIVWLTIDCLILSVFYKFWQTGKEWAK